jgi:hypothetical protein
MKKLWLLLLALPLIVWAQSPNFVPQSSSALPGGLNIIAKYLAPQNGLPVMGPSLLQDTGSQLLYNGTPVGLTPTTATCLAAAAPLTAPCVVATGTATGFGVASTSGTITLYTANAPNHATFSICPTIYIDTAGTAGNAVVNMAWTTPSGVVLSGYGFQTISLTAAGSLANFCQTFSTKLNTSASFVISAVGGTGSPVWEYSYNVTRMN